MDERLRRAAQLGDIDALYESIKKDADIFRRIDEMKFFDTPLHIAAAAGHTDFAMEVINLNPSFARKLNPAGFTPIHLALQNQQTEMVVDLVSIDKDLVRVKGREGYTPLHIVSRDGNVPLLSQFLNDCPNCILLDLTIRKETALHIAAQNRRLEALKALLQWVQKIPQDNQRRRILNLQDKNGNTVLHIAAANNQPQMIKLLTKFEEVDRNMINGRGLTALDIVSQRQTDQIDSESVNILRKADHEVSKPSRIFEVSRFHTKLGDDLKEMKPETTNALLIVFTLILTMTYQAVLSPPGGVLQDVGKSVMRRRGFILFYLPNGIAFLISWIITISLLSVVVAKSIIWLVLPLHLMICFCYGVASGTIAPKGLTSWLVAYGPIFITMLIYYLSLFRFRKQ